MQSTYYIPTPVRDPFNNAKYKSPSRVTDPFNASHRSDTTRRGSSYTVASFSTRSSRSRSRPSSHTSDSSSPSPTRTSRSKSRDGRSRRRESFYEPHEHHDYDSLSPDYSPRVNKSRSRSRNQNPHFPPIADTLEPHEDYFSHQRRGSNTATLSPESAEICRCRSRASVRSKAISFSPPSELSISSPPPPYSRASPPKSRVSMAPPEYRHRANSIYSRNTNKISPSKLSPKSYTDWDNGIEDDSDEEDYDGDYRQKGRRPSVRRGSTVSQKDNAGNRIAAFLASFVQPGVSACLSCVANKNRTGRNSRL